jgi:hypothetical protein
MSHFVECQTEFRDRAALVAALVECGFPESQIEVHEQAVPLYGYRGDVRPQNAHVVIRRQHVGSGLTITRLSRQPAQSQDSRTQKIRSRFRSLGHFINTWRIASYWRSARFSTARAAQGRSKARRKPKISRITSSASPPFGSRQGGS